MPCPSCAARLVEQPNNTRVADVLCQGCGARFELKSTKGRFGPKVADGAHATMMSQIAAGGPGFAFLRYDARSWRARDLFLVPGSFLTAAAIERRPPLGPQARRAGWVGCTIRLAEVPAAGRIAVLDDGVARPFGEVAAAWRRAEGLAAADFARRTWMVDVLRCLERLGDDAFALTDAYGFVAELAARHPGNRHIREKIRQQLQRLRDAGFIAFLGGGRYRLVRHPSSE